MNTNVPNPFVTKGRIVLSGAGRKKITSNDSIRIIPGRISEKPPNIKYPKPPKNKKPRKKKEEDSDEEYDMNDAPEDIWDDFTGRVLGFGGGKKRTMEMKPEDWARMRKARGEPEYKLYGVGMDDDMDGAGFFDKVKKGYQKVKGAVKSETGQKIKKALLEDEEFMKQFNKAKKELKDYTEGTRKSKPGKAAMAILEKAGVISKIKDEFKGGAKRGPSSWISFVKKYAEKNNIPYEQALKEASPIYKKMKNKM